MKVDAIREVKPPLTAVRLTLMPFEAEQLRDLFNALYGRDAVPYPVMGVNVTRASLGRWANQLAEVLA